VARHDYASDVDLLLSSLGGAIRPRPRMAPSEWARLNFVLPDGPRKGQLWDPADTPYVCEPIDAMAVDGVDTEATVAKSAQTGFSTAGLILLGYWMDTEPDAMLAIQPTIPAARDFNADKLGPAIKASPALSRLVLPSTGRGGEGSTTLRKVFAGGSLIITGANSAADLASKTNRFQLRDELDRWPLDLEGQGDPEKMADERQTAFTRSSLHKRFRISTPAARRTSRIWRHFEAGDRRRWHVPCPECGTAIVLMFERLRFQDRKPHKAHYEAQCCGSLIEPHYQRGMVQAGRYIPEITEPGRPKSWHVDAMSSLLTSWDEIAGKFVESRGDEPAKRTFVNLTLGLPSDDDDPETDPVRIVAAAEDRPANVVPARVGRLILTFDTQDDRLEWALHGFGPSPTGLRIDQWLIAAGVIEGDPNEADIWDEAGKLLERRWPSEAGGPDLSIDLAAIDSGGHHTRSVYAFGRGRRAKLRVLKGRGEGLPVGTPSRPQIKDARGRLLFKIQLYPVGTNDLKLWLRSALADLAKLGVTPPGGLHLPRELATDAYVRQLTAEILTDKVGRDGRVRRVWEQIIGQPNEALDLAVYARAFALGAWPNGLGLERMDGAAWSKLIAERHGLYPDQSDLFGPQSTRVPDQAPVAVSDTPVSSPVATPPPQPTQRPQPGPAAPRRAFAPRIRNK
jgi:phage terminase large subunit GpA-like protein